ncbi:MAG TPA: ATPase, T2SS/T4P/T4SS family [Acidimicrobiales bacterium]|nr:ATPase, T2SS/T4P/T4SS family [Acidimicrobiales bacterium]
MAPRERLGDILLETTEITNADLEAALTVQKEVSERLGKILLDKGLIRPTDLLRALARQAGVRFVDLEGVAVDWSVAQSIPLAMARRHRALPIAYEDERVVVAMANPADVLALDDLRTLLRRELVVALVDPAQLHAALDRAASSETEVAEALQAAAEEADEVAGPQELVEDSVADAPIVRFVQAVIGRAIAGRASDVHVEPDEKGLRVRLRIDGVLHDAMRAPASLRAGIVSRIKVMADLDIAERRLPQDGRSRVRTGGRTIDMRVATVPTVHGEAAVLRLLDTKETGHSLADLSMDEDVLARWESAYRRPWGAVLVTGPTGSGKTTTLHATLSELNDESRNLITVEDPVEYMLSGVKQVQVNTAAGLTFASALRSFLRADPDVILVGEIRDHETAVIAAEASLTGHLVLSSLHTNDAASAPLRLTEIGVAPFLVTSAVQAVLAQRLARRLCDRCKVPYEPNDVELCEARWPAGWPTPEFHRAVGCSACSATGYRGRLAVHEVLLMSEGLRRLVLERAGADQLRKVAIEEGMVPLWDDGLKKVAHGLTTVEELARVVT